MDANFLLGVATVATMGVGIWGLVFRKNGNGHAENHPEQPVIVEYPVEDGQTAQLREAIQHLPAGLEQAFRSVAEAQTKEPEVPPEWSARMLSDLEHIQEELHEPAWQAQLAQVAIKLERLSESLEAFMQLPPPPAPEIPQVDELIAEIRALVNKPPSIKGTSAMETEAPPARPSPTVAPPSPRGSKPIQRAAAPVLLDEFNTIAVVEDTVYELRPPEDGVFNANVLNLGPGWLYVRANAEPIIGDPKATTLPPGALDNEVRIAQRLYVVASADGSITVRLAH